MHSDTSRTLHHGLMVLFALGLLHTSALGDPPFVATEIERIRANPRASAALHDRFVANSLELVAGGADRADVVDALAAIASIQGPLGRLNAIDPLIHIGGDDPMVEAHLVNLMTSDEVYSGVRSRAGVYLSLGIEEPTRAKLRNYCKNHSGSQSYLGSPLITDAGDVLMACGDTVYLELLEAQVNTSPPDSTVSILCQRRARLMQLSAGPLPEMLRVIASSQPWLHRPWLVLQAARRGADRKELRDAAVAYLRLPAEVAPKQSNILLVGICDQLRIFPPADEAEFVTPPAIRAGSTERNPKHWATYRATKWRKVHRVPEVATAAD